VPKVYDTYRAYRFVAGMSRGPEERLHGGQSKRIVSMYSVMAALAS
jgi:hypothetical protein